MTTFANGESGLSVRTKINNVLQHADGTAGEIAFNDAGADVDFRVESDTNANALFVDGATGNVGIGTSSPVNNAGYGGMTINGASGAMLSMMQDGSETFRVTNATGYSFVNTTGATPLLLGTSATERMRIDASGNVGIGTSSPAAKLVVNSPSALASVPAVGSKTGLFVATVGAQDYGLISGALTSGAYFFQSQATDGSTLATYPIMLNPNGGNILIGTATSGASKLRISGLPTSSAGLSAGDVWNDGGTLKIA